MYIVYLIHVVGETVKTYTKPENPKVIADGGEHLNDCCQDDGVYGIPICTCIQNERMYNPGCNVNVMEARR